VGEVITAGRAANRAMGERGRAVPRAERCAYERIALCYVRYQQERYRSELVDRKWVAVPDFALWERWWAYGLSDGVWRPLWTAKCGYPLSLAEDRVQQAVARSQRATQVVPVVEVMPLAVYRAMRTEVAA
jgi:hypothetical protein